MLNIETIYSKIPVFLKAAYPNKYEAIVEYISTNGIELVNDQLYAHALAAVLVSCACRKRDLKTLLEEMIMSTDKRGTDYVWMITCAEEKAYNAIFMMLVRYTSKPQWVNVFNEQAVPSNVQKQDMKQVLIDSEARWMPILSPEEIVCVQEKYYEI